MKALFLLAALPLAACNEITSPTGAASVSPAPVLSAPTTGAREVLVNDKSNVELVLVACNGETVVLSGKQHYVVNVSTDHNGNTKLSVSNNTHFSGYGTVTGAKYEGELVYMDKEASTDDQFTFNTSTVLKLKGQGKVPDTDLEFSTKFTVHADGSVTGEDDDFKSTCK